jgi:hypothetical protein
MSEEAEEVGSLATSHRNADIGLEGARWNIAIGILFVFLLKSAYLLGLNAKCKEILCWMRLSDKRVSYLNCRD